jgi:hypothetical protein
MKPTAKTRTGTKNAELEMKSRNSKPTARGGANTGTTAKTTTA